MPHVIPIPTGEKLIIVIVLDTQNMTRMAAADPPIMDGALLSKMVEDAGKKLGYPEHLGCTHLHNVTLLMCYEEDIGKFIGLAQSCRKDHQKLLDYLQRGYQDKPGDKLAYNLSDLLEAAANGKTN